MNSFFRKKISSTAVWLMLSFVVLVPLCLLFPYTGDDWAWGSSIGLERLATGFADYNGRYFGNLVVLLLTRNLVFRSVIVAAAVVAIAYLVYVLSGRRNVAVYLMALLLLLCMPAKMAAQSIVWVSGFTNYAIPSLFILIYACLCLPLFENTKLVNEKTAVAIVALFLGLANALIVENITLMNVVIGFSMLIYCRKTKCVWSKVQILFLVGAILGSVLMFSNGAYTNIANGADAYREVADDKFVFAFERAIKYMPYWIYSYLWPVPVCGAVSMMLGLKQTASYSASDNSASDSLGKRYGHNHHERLFFVILTVAFALLAAFAVYCSTVKTPAGSLRNTLAFWGSIAQITIFIIYCWYTRGTPVSRKILFLVLCIVIMVAPLYLVNPVGSRNFLPVYVLECSIVCLLFAEHLQMKGNEHKVASKAAILAICMLLVLVLMDWYKVYGAIHEADELRDSQVTAAVESGSKSVKVAKLPYEKHVHCPDPTDGTWEMRYKLFHGFPDELDIQLEGE